jgi:hypothetical protein
MLEMIIVFRNATIVMSALYFVINKQFTYCVVISNIKVRLYRMHFLPFKR